MYSISFIFLTLKRSGIEGKRIIFILESVQSVFNYNNDSMIDEVSRFSTNRNGTEYWKCVKFVLIFIGLYSLRFFKNSLHIDEYYCSVQTKNSIEQCWQLSSQANNKETQNKINSQQHWFFCSIFLLVKDRGVYVACTAYFLWVYTPTRLLLTNRFSREYIRTEEFYVEYWKIKAATAWYGGSKLFPQLYF